MPLYSAKDTLYIKQYTMITVYNDKYPTKYSFIKLLLCSSEQIKACCDVLDKLLSASDAVSVVNTFHRELLLGLNHPSDTVQRLTLSQVDKFVSVFQS